ncbi:uncharacterized protein LOC129002114 [Macrosteles quadrilineatus]|uniref:uncharacterized protein LOC129002114 n=1 Tax=Macrosteles quadrilineatus TaxID=74068 RepID=UPI0023E0D2DF|nr:uncharacterized protein LOC129002114 [Macrosteles quadrilineatus]
MEPPSPSKQSAQCESVKPNSSENEDKDEKIEGKVNKEKNKDTGKEENNIVKELKKTEGINEGKKKDNGRQVSDMVEESKKTAELHEEHKRDNGKKESDRTVTFSDTQIEISDTEDEDLTYTNGTNPRITISEPVNSPSEEKKPAEEPARARCPIYYGIKSYIHDFYDPPDREVFKSGEYIQEDDFQFLVEPGKRRWRGCWLRVGLWVGVNLMLVGIIAMLVGHLTAPRDTVVHQQDHYTVLDSWAVTYNNRLIICQLAGLIGFTSGGVIVMLVLLVSSYQQDQARSYYVMAATVVPETFVGNPIAGPKEGWGSHRIPLSGVVRGVQPCFQGTN